MLDYTPCQKRMRAYDKACDRLTNELDISNILFQLRDIHGMIHYMKTDRHRQMSKFQIDQVI